MECPKCSAPMEKVAYEKVEIDRCTECKGIWFDMLEHEDLKKLAGSESVDTGAPAVGRKQDAVTRIQCPVCHTSMIKMADADQPHIHFEGCTVCYGVFLDAGEFTDFKQESFVERVRDLLAAPQT